MLFPCKSLFSSQVPVASEVAAEADLISLRLPNMKAIKCWCFITCSRPTLLEVFRCSASSSSRIYFPLTFRGLSSRTSALPSPFPAMPPYTNTDSPPWRLSKSPPSPSPLLRRAWHRLLLARYRFEVTFSAYMMSGLEKACLYAALVTLLLVGLALASYPARLLLALVLRPAGSSDTLFFLPAASTTRSWLLFVGVLGYDPPDTEFFTNATALLL
jgi:hypothetical protein